MKVVSEDKLPWLAENRLDVCTTNPLLLRRLLAQTILYMLELDCVYGFVTNYEQAMFLRQVQVRSTWRIEYSPVIE